MQIRRQRKNWRKKHKSREKMIVNNKLQLKQWIFNAFRLECFPIDEKSRRLILSGCGIFPFELRNFINKLFFSSYSPAILNWIIQLKSYVPDEYATNHSALCELILECELQIHYFDRDGCCGSCCACSCFVQRNAEMNFLIGRRTAFNPNRMDLLFYDIPCRYFPIGIICMISEESHMRRNVLKWNKTRLVCVWRFAFLFAIWIAVLFSRSQFYSCGVSVDWHDTFVI